MASVENWSDNEIRSKLAELGSPVGPVTETTRRILVKKLKHLLQADISRNASSPSKQRRNLSRFSSGEDDSQDEDIPSMPPPTGVRSLRRRTIGATDVSASAAGSNDSALQTGTSKVSSSKVTRKSIVGVSSVTKKTDGFDTGSDSDVTEIAVDEKIRKRKSLRTEPVTPPRHIASPRPSVLSTQREHTSRTIESSRIYGPYGEYSKEKVKEEVPLPRTSTLYRPEFRRFEAKSRPTDTIYRSSVSPKRESPNAYDSNKVDHTDNFQKRVSNFTDRYQKRVSEFTDDYQKRLSAARDYLSNRAVDTQTGTSPKSNKYDAWFSSKYHNSTMLYVVIGVLVLLLILGLLYMNFTSTPIGLDGDDSIYPLCESGQNKTVCIESKNLDAALKAYNLLLPKLQDVAVKAYCNPSSSSDLVQTSTVSENAALAYLGKKLPGNKTWELERNLRDVKILVLSNPQWDIKVVDETSTSTEDVKTLVVTGGFLCSNPSLPVGCYVQIILYVFGRWAFVLLTVAGVISGSFYGVRWYKHRHEQHKCNVYSMVNKILMMLQTHYEQDQDASPLVVDNCRDELILPIHRTTRKGVWDDAVDFIEKNESRVRTEMHNVGGENFKIWRWLPAGGPSLSPSGRNTSFNRLL